MIGGTNKTVCPTCKAPAMMTEVPAAYDTRDEYQYIGNVSDAVIRNLVEWSILAAESLESEGIGEYITTNLRDAVTHVHTMTGIAPGTSNELASGGWILVSDLSGVSYLAPGPGFRWTRVRDEALRFASREQAEAMYPSGAGTHVERFTAALTEAKQQGPGEAVIVGYDPGQDDREAEDYHVIMAMGRLLAAIAISVKGPEPAGTAWSYHDLPDIVAALQEAAEQVADEMTAWAATKMADRGSSRRDRLMISEWAKRLRNPEIFPVKDFEVEGTTLTKEEMRAIVRKVIASSPQVEAKRQTGGDA